MIYAGKLVESHQISLLSFKQEKYHQNPTKKSKSKKRKKKDEEKKDRRRIVKARNKNENKKEKQKEMKNKQKGRDLHKSWGPSYKGKEMQNGYSQNENSRRTIGYFESLHALIAVSFLLTLSETNETSERLEEFKSFI